MADDSHDLGDGVGPQSPTVNMNVEQLNDETMIDNDEEKEEVQVPDPESDHKEDPDLDINQLNDETIIDDDEEKEEVQVPDPESEHGEVPDLDAKQLNDETMIDDDVEAEVPDPESEYGEDPANDKESHPHDGEDIEEDFNSLEDQNGEDDIIRQKSLNEEELEDTSMEDNGSSALFVPETSVHRPTPPPAPSLPTLLRPALSRPGLSRLLPSSLCQRGDSATSRIRDIQKKLQEKKKKVAQPPRTLYPSFANPDDEAYLEAVLPRAVPSMSTTAPEVSDEDEQRAALAAFQKHQTYYTEMKRKNGGKLSFRHDVDWMKIKGAEDARKKKRQRELAKAREEEEGELSLFPDAYRAADNDQDDDSDTAPVTGNGSRKRRQRELPRKTAKQMSMQAAELFSMQVALEAVEDLPRKKAKKGASADNGVPDPGPTGRGRGSKSKTGSTSRAKAKPKGSGKGRGAKSKREIDLAVRQATSLFNSNVFQQQADAGAADQPTFRSRVKADALKELIASVPLENQKKAKDDMHSLRAALKEFDGRGAVKSDGASLWIVSGMRTSLKAYQILGTSFMRRRENDSAEPKGGLMADQMGLGKTLMMLANIVNGRPPKGAGGPKTTLLVAGPALLTQWKNEIEQHTSIGLKMMRYGTGTRVDSNGAHDIILGHDIVFTTYTEIMRSYPKNEAPIDRITAEQKLAWWKEEYETKRGILHRVMFLRIVLDEAQAIKNHTGRTSIACRALMAHHKWALSGTPILNSLTELYPYFKFLGVPHTGSFKIFKHNYCDSANVENTERLLMRLSQFMIRRTHADEMFGAPILKLPQADQTTYWCEFNSVERRIYGIVHARFATKINMMAKSGELEKSYSNALVMLLRLRQLTAHILMLQFVMQDLLEREDIENIMEVVKDEAANTSEHNSKQIKQIRRTLENLAKVEKKKSAAKAAADNARRAAEKAERKVNDTDGIDLPVDDDLELDLDNEEDPLDDPNNAAHPIAKHLASGKDFGKSYNFKPYLSSLKSGATWEKIKKKAKCFFCEKQPYKPMVTSCGHLICSTPCKAEADLQAAEQEKQNFTCKACGKIVFYSHPCDADDDDGFDTVAQSTRSKAKTKNDKARVRRDREAIAEDWLSAGGGDVLPSAKTIAAKAQILNWTKENPGVKVIIYTQFLAMIRILARICQQEGWKVEQYHGQMSFSARDKAIESFAKNANVKVMLASLRCGGLGLNLTMASKVIMIDPWWNSASEQQAFCRVFRIGQKEETFMSRLCVKDTVDQRLMEIQDRKEREISSVMENDGSLNKKISVRDLMKLFGNLEEDPEGRPFILVDNPNPMGGFRADRDDEGFADES